MSHATTWIWIVDYLCDHKESDFQYLSTDELGELIDMLKDISEIQKNMAKQCYYHKVVEAMDTAVQPNMEYMEPESKQMYIRHGLYHDESHTTDELVDSIKTMWDESDSELKQQMKTQLTACLNTLK